MLHLKSVFYCFISFFVGQLFCAHAASESGVAGAEMCAEDLNFIQVSQKVATLHRNDMKIGAVKEYPWSQRGRDYTQRSSTPYIAPSNFDDGPTWIWPNEEDEEVRHSPLIDNDKNIYVTTGYKVRKFTSDGDLLWTFEQDNSVVSAPALYEGAIYLVAAFPATLYAIDMVKGTVILNKSFAPRKQNTQATSVFVYNDTVLFPMQTSSNENKNSLYATKTDGSFLWEYEPDDVVWNFSPSSPGDGTIFFSGACGTQFRITFDGKEIWKASGTPRAGDPPEYCGTGGAAVGTNGILYSEYNDGATGVATVNARNASDGKLLWTKEYGVATGNQYPAFGEVGNNPGRLAVVVAIGPNTDIQEAPQPLSEEEALPNTLLALDPETGETIWRYDEPRWPHRMAAGDDHVQERIMKMQSNPKQEFICLPDMQGIPLIAGDGTVYMSSSHSGDLRAIKDTNGDGKIDASEVSTFSTKKCFLNSPSIAPGMLVAAPCWGPMYVFKSLCASTRGLPLVFSLLLASLVRWSL